MICLYRQLDSTQDELKRLLAAGVEVPPGGVIQAWHQTAGRGRYGRRWTDAQGHNALFSFWLAPHLPYDRSFLLYQTAAVAMAEALNAEGIEAIIKFPNDLLWKGLKLGGILIENTMRKNEIVRSIVGIGLNVNQTVFPAELQAVSVRMITGRFTPPEAWTGLLMRSFENWWNRSARDIQARYLYYWQFKGPKTAAEVPGKGTVKINDSFWSAQKWYIIPAKKAEPLAADPRQIRLLG